MGSADERRRYFVMPILFGWALTQNAPADDSFTRNSMLPLKLRKAHGKWVISLKFEYLPDAYAYNGISNLIGDRVFVPRLPYAQHKDMDL